MNTDLTWQTVSTGSDDTERLAARLGNRLRGGEVIELVSDVGGGKTTFVRGLARGMKSSDKVASPTFTISREYKAGKLTLHHFDFYRLNDPGIVANELSELVGEPHAVIVVELADIVEDVLPTSMLVIHIKSTDETTRKFIFSYSKDLAYLFP